MPMDDVSRLYTDRAELDAASESDQRKTVRKAIAPKKARVNATPILHFLSTQSFASPFDVNMAVDAGFKVVIPHTNVRLDNTAGLVQDAIFSGRRITVAARASLSAVKTHCWRSKC